MTDCVWSRPERRDLYLASRLLAERTCDGDWLQWASDTLVQDLELYDDPRQGVGTWLFEDEVDLANDLGERLWSIIQSNPFNAAQLLTAEDAALRQIASNLIERMEANGRVCPEGQQRVKSESGSQPALPSRLLRLISAIASRVGPTPSANLLTEQGGSLPPKERMWPVRQPNGSQPPKRRCPSRREKGRYERREDQS